MKFVDDTELAVFLWRHFSKTIEMRKFIPSSNEALTSRLEELVSETKGWRFNETNATNFIEEVIDSVNYDAIIKKLKECSFIVGKDREREIIDELLEINVNVEVAKSIPENLEESIRLLAAVISIAVYPKDILSMSFVLSVLCPSVLLALKNFSVSKRLNMALSLIAYVQKAVIDGDEGEDPVMKENIIFLKKFLKTIEDIHDKFDEMKEPRKGIRAGFEVANRFLISCETFASSNMSPALKVVYLVIDEVSSNYVEIMQAAPNDQQTKPSFFKETERICQSVVDRLTIMAPIMDVTSFSPNFRTPSKPLTPAKVTVFQSTSENKLTPISISQKRPTTFINNQTPTPIRNPVKTLQEFLDEDKENIDPNAVGLFVDFADKENKERAPIRAPKGRGLRVRKSFGNTNEAKRAPTQRSIVSFFK